MRRFTGRDMEGHVLEQTEQDSGGGPAARGHAWQDTKPCAGISVKLLWATESSIDQYVPFLGFESTHRQGRHFGGPQSMDMSWPAYVHSHKAVDRSQSWFEHLSRCGVGCGSWGMTRGCSVWNGGGSGSRCQGFMSGLPVLLSEPFNLLAP